ncbi:hypothetical protein TWF481_012096 [Arthrobotrys musiformis]|uniref:G domain-containing protein n=1 Tax=Arthrobotrys musiformis TaxID=47236 RepID=A0AAV9VXL1_9PEZI
MEKNTNDPVRDLSLEMSISGMEYTSGDDADGESAYSILTPTEAPSNIDEDFFLLSSKNPGLNLPQLDLDSKEFKCENDTTNIIEIPLCKACKERHYRRRLVICADTADCDPSRTQDRSSMYSVSRLVCSGQVKDALSGEIVVQTTIYKGGLGIDSDSESKNDTAALDPNTEVDWAEETRLAIERSLKKSVRDIYTIICKASQCTSDEVFLFGEGAAASVLVATVKLLHFFGILSGPKAPSQESELERAFESAWEFCVKPQSFIDQGDTAFHQTPKIPFMGLIEVDPLPYPGLENLPATIFDAQNTYHALGLNQVEGAGVARLQLPPSTSGREITEAWFFGNRKDLDGTRSENGLSLWPLQWLLFEGSAKGLVLDVGFFPEEQDDTKNLSVAETFLLQGQQYPFRFFNGVELNIWDVSQIFDVQGHQLEFEGSWSWTDWFGTKRRVFNDDDDGALCEYGVENRKKTIIHPSVFYHKDQFSKTANWDCYNEQIEAFRRTQIDGNWSQYFWVSKMVLPHKFRILVCGNTGVGKSTLINSVFDTTEAKETFEDQTNHDIEKEIVVDQINGEDSVIIHDSNGFETGNDEKNKQAESFIERRSYKSYNPNVDDYIHCIWYCIPAEDPQKGDASIQRIFSKCFQEWKIPLVVVYTKSIRHEGGMKEDIKAAYRLRYRRDIPEGVLARNLDRERLRYRSQQSKWIVELYKDCLGLSSLSNEEAEERGKSAFRIVWTDKNDPESLKELIRETYDLIGPNIGHVFVKAQKVSHDLKFKQAVEDGVRAIKGTDYLRIIRRHRNQVAELREMGKTILKTFAWDLDDPSICDIMGGDKDIGGRNFFMATGVAGTSTGVAAAAAIAIESGIIIVDEAVIGIAGATATIGAVALGAVTAVGGGVALWALKRHQISKWATFLCCFTIITYRATVAAARNERQLTVEDFKNHKLTDKEYDAIKKEIDEFVTMKRCIVFDYPGLGRKAHSIVSGYCL